MTTSLDSAFWQDPSFIAFSQRRHEARMAALEESQYVVRFIEELRADCLQRAVYQFPNEAEERNFFKFLEEDEEASVDWSEHVLTSRDLGLI